MINAASRIAGLATLALAALPIVAIATGANAATATVKVSDLNLNSAAGVAAFHQRAEWAARSFCHDATRPVSKINAAARCETAVKAEIQEKLAVAQSGQLSRAATYAAR